MPWRKLTSRRRCTIRQVRMNQWSQLACSPPGSAQQDSELSEDPDYVVESSTESTAEESVDPEEESTAESAGTPSSKIFATGIQLTRGTAHESHNSTHSQNQAPEQHSREQNTFISQQSFGPNAGITLNLLSEQVASQAVGGMVQQPAPHPADFSSGSGPSSIAHTIAEVHLARLQAGERTRTGSSPNQPRENQSTAVPHPDSPRVREVKRTPPATSRLGVAFKSPRGNSTRPALQLLRANVPKGAKTPPSINSIKGLARKSSANRDPMQVIYE
jgi:hypothetical protein